jgi:colicin import membrane protein
MWKAIRENPRAVTYAVLMHLVLLALLVIGLDWTPKVTAPPGVKVPIEAELVTQDPLRQIEQRKQQELERQKAAEAKQKAEAEAKRKAEVEAKQKAETEAKQQAEAEAKQQAAAEAKQKATAEAKQKAAAEAKQKAAAEAKQKAAAEAKQQAAAEAKQKAAAEAKQKAEAEAKKKAELEAKRKAEEAERREAEAALQAQLAEEAEQRRALSELEKFIPYIQQKVQSNWIRPPGSPPGLVCVVNVRLIPGGEVVSAKVVQGSGDPLFDRSVESAVLKASPLPLPNDATLFRHFREINFKFNPGR